jgi:hypothetical protein
MAAHPLPTAYGSSLRSSGHTTVLITGYEEDARDLYPSNEGEESRFGGKRSAWSQAKGHEAYLDERGHGELRFRQCDTVGS